MWIVKYLVIASIIISTGANATTIRPIRDGIVMPPPVDMEQQIKRLKR
jgi:hypothetical protein